MINSLLKGIKKRNVHIYSPFKKFAHVVRTCLGMANIVCWHHGKYYEIPPNNKSLALEELLGKITQEKIVIDTSRV